jgi:hypothetical protein
VVSGFRSEVDENCVLLDYKGGRSDFLTEVSGKPIGPIFGGSLAPKCLIPTASSYGRYLLHSLANDKSHMSAATTAVVYALFVYLRFITIIQSSKHRIFFNEGATDRLPRNVGQKLPLLAA